MDLSEILGNAAGTWGTRTALVSAGQRLSYQELEEDSNRVAHFLAGLGINRGDRIAILLPNSPEYVVLFFGITKIGAVAVPLDIKYKDYELKTKCNIKVQSLYSTT